MSSSVILDTIVKLNGLIYDLNELLSIAKRIKLNTLDITPVIEKKALVESQLVDLKSQLYQIQDKCDHKGSIDKYINCQKCYKSLGAFQPWD